MSELSPFAERPLVLIVGGGFVGLQCVLGLSSAPVEIILADRHNYHLFQPLLYQVATTVFSPADNAAPIRRVLRRQKNAPVVLVRAERRSTGERGPEIMESLEIELDSQGRVPVEPDLSLPGHPEVFVVGDLAHVRDSRTAQPVPGVAPAAIQMKRYVARVIRAEVTSRNRAPQRMAFRYYDKGGMTTIGRNRAVAYIAGRHFTGFFAWLIWSQVHIIPLVDFHSRLSVISSWVWSYFSVSKNARLITGRPKMKVKEALGVIPNDKTQK